MQNCNVTGSVVRRTWESGAILWPSSAYVEGGQVEFVQTADEGLVAGGWKQRGGR